MTYTAVGALGLLVGLLTRAVLGLRDRVTRLEALEERRHRRESSRADE